MQEEYEKIYEKLYLKHWWWRAREKFIIDIVSQYKPKVRDNLILDIGCGNGLIFDSMKPFGKIEGIEASQNVVNESGRNRGKIKIGKAKELLLEPKRFDIILLLDVIEHVQDDCDLIDTAKKLLSQEGKIFITVPAHQFLWTKHDDVNLHLRRYNKRTLTSKLSQLNLSILHIEFKFVLVAYIKLLLAIIYKISPKKSQLESLPIIPNEFISNFLEKLTYFENRLPSFMRFFGSSIFCIAEIDIVGMEIAEKNTIKTNS